MNLAVNFKKYLVIALAGLVLTACATQKKSIDFFCVAQAVKTNPASAITKYFLKFTAKFMYYSLIVTNTFRLYLKSQ